jgi:hypothetical protein
MSDNSKVVTVRRLNRFLGKLKDLITPEWLGLGNVDNTTDSEKNVAFASEAGTARKIKYNLVIRLKGGRTEGTDMWTYDGATAKSINITAAKIGAVAASQGAAKAGTILYVNESGEVVTIDLATLKSLLNSVS